MTLEGTGGRLLQAVRTRKWNSTTNDDYACYSRKNVAYYVEIDGDSIDTPSQCIVMTEVYAINVSKATVLS